MAIKIKEGESTYADVLKNARQRINIEELGIKNLKIRTVANDGVLVEIPALTDLRGRMHSRITLDEQWEMESM